MEKLISLGWNTFFEDQYKKYKEKGFITARVAVEHKQRYLLYSEMGELTGEVTGKLLYSADSLSDLPKTGDWVVGIFYEDEKKIIIHEVLERKTKLSRKSPDKKISEQIIAANVDIVFIVQSMDNNFNPRRLERYLTAVYECGAKPVIILNKSDLIEKPEEKINKLKNIENFPEIILTSAVTGEGIDDLKKLINNGITAVFTGSSGVGKSTLINSILGKELLKTAEISSSVLKGKHTTVRRELILIPDGGILIDTPGMREFQLWNASDGIEETFDEIEMLAEGCKYSDCTHMVEPDCAVLKALSEGKLSPGRYDSYKKLLKEINYLEEKQDINARLLKKAKEKKLNKLIKNYYKIIKK